MAPSLTNLICIRYILLMDMFQNKNYHGPMSLRCAGYDPFSDGRAAAAIGSPGIQAATVSSVDSVW